MLFMDRVYFPQPSPAQPSPAQPSPAQPSPAQSNSTNPPNAALYLQIVTYIVHQISSLSGINKN
ncbi:hypothetical protein FNF96_20275 [Salmonella enterica]|nr:hypothetical protein [Salmonella enterica]ECQ2009919.1 hypothetical protein [Salmonella enterica]ECZ8475128.1 hypothetical protein [Salmonella enterica]EDN2239060.1 hypothetical protein [Salmonella enterica]EDY7419622.1 hypothetical protein [Salmonella enterica]